MKRFVKISAPPDNPDAGKLPDFPDPYDERKTHPDRIVFSQYDIHARRGEWPEPNPGELRPDYGARGHVPNYPNNLFHNSISNWQSGNGYDPTCQLVIDAREIFENDKGGFSFGGRGDSYRISSWSTRLTALHLKD